MVEDLNSNTIFFPPSFKSFPPLLIEWIVAVKRCTFIASIKKHEFIDIMVSIWRSFTLEVIKFWLLVLLGKSLGKIKCYQRISKIDSLF